MQIIEVTHPYQHQSSTPIVLALGFFDGVHQGHQQVIETARRLADERGYELAVMTFNQHPKLVYQVLSPTEMKYLTPIEPKMTLFEQYGVDTVYLVDFTYDFGHQTPQEFVDRYIVGLNAQVVVAGYDYTYGIPDKANMQTLPVHAQGRFDIVEVPQYCFADEKVGSTAIRQWVQSNDIDKANEALGHPYETRGVVIHGAKRGRTIGYPTANILMEEEYLLPSRGVYVVECYVQGEWHKGMASIGYNVTFELLPTLSCEVYLFDFNHMIYGEHVRVRWYHYLRDEVKFDGIDGLIEQLQQDERDSRAYFAARG